MLNEVLGLTHPTSVPEISEISFRQTQICLALSILEEIFETLKYSDNSRLHKNTGLHARPQRSLSLTPVGFFTCTETANVPVGYFHLEHCVVELVSNPINCTNPSNTNPA